jgi:hypothetical protein
MAFGFKVKTKLPPEFKIAKDAADEIKATSKQTTNVVKSYGTTVELAVVAGVFGLLVFGIILKQTFVDKE